MEHCAIKELCSHALVQQQHGKERVDGRRMVFMPFSLQLRHAKQHGQAGQDLRIQAPEISATLSSREFLSFVNVVR